ncbi:MAG: cold shock domain-containing protein [Candidatus Hydrogenedentes bacterium]|nr:cold shock domain-containing protein [Candidatus Hydrogenedentota bacterium]
MSEASGNLRGTVKWFNAQKGYGFISHEGGEDVFVHHSSIVMEGYRTLQEGQEVTYELGDSEKGPIAVNVASATATPPAAE